VSTPEGVQGEGREERWRRTLTDAIMSTPAGRRATRNLTDVSIEWEEWKGVTKKKKGGTTPPSGSGAGH